jgi:membrane protein
MRIFSGLGCGELLRGVWRQFWKGRILDQAAMLSFYFILSTFPLLLFLVALLGLMLQSDQTLHKALHEYLAKLAPASASGLMDGTLQQIQQGSGRGTLSIGLVFSLWVASTGLTALMDALNAAYGVEESRTWWKRRLIALALSIGSALLMAAAILLLGFGAHLVALLQGHSGAHNGWVKPVWTVLRYVLLLGFLVVAFNLLYMYAPNVSHRKWRWLMPGSVLGVALWVLASYGFKLYLTLFNSYNLTYGSIAAVIILLLWFHLTAIAILLGGELNSEIEQGAEKARKPPAHPSS